MLLLLFCLSLPTRERGLKLKAFDDAVSEGSVAPHAGAWIETDCVYRFTIDEQSLPTRERGLKLAKDGAIDSIEKSLPTRERGLKRRLGLHVYRLSSRSPRGSVD